MDTETDYRKIAQNGMAYALRTGRFSTEAMIKINKMSEPEQYSFINQVASKMTVGSPHEAWEIGEELLSGHKPIIA